ncbi:malectin [Trichonephila clavipes]|nr:malectin [Trichonephila clavipes]
MTSNLFSFDRAEEECPRCEIIYAINAGGESHVDSDGIHYRRDPLHGRIGTASDYGKQLIISRVPRTDQILYQTERYHHATFGYEIPVNKDGDYVLVLKFCEVYFSSPGMKVFDVTLNGVHTIVSDLDIFAKVGKGVAHDEHVPFTVKGNKLIVNEEESEHDGKIRVEFIKQKLYRSFEFIVLVDPLESSASKNPEPDEH